MSLAQTQQQARDIEDMRTVLFGNGTKGSGLKSMVETHDTILQSWLESQKEYKRAKIQVVTAVIIAVVLACGAFFWNAGKLQAASELLNQASQKIDATAQEIKAAE